MKRMIRFPDQLSGRLERLNVFLIQNAGELEQLIRLHDRLCGKMERLYCFLVQNGGEPERLIRELKQMDLLLARINAEHFRL